MAQIFGTFGLYRFYLACMVLWSHSGTGEHIYAGYYAVFAFYILSGYVVSHILHNTYLPQPNGIRAFALNRFLRIFPLYWVVFAFSLYLVSHYPTQAQDINWFFGIPNSTYTWLVNIFTFGMVHPLLGSTVKPLVVPLGWSLGVELLFWMLMPSLMRSKLARIILGAFAFIYTALVIWLSLTYDATSSLPIRYISPLAATLPFFLGLYLFRRKLKNPIPIPPLWGALAIVAHLTLMFAAPQLFAEPNFTGFYLILPLSFLITAALSQCNNSTISPHLKKADSFFGTLAYPIYLLHMPVSVALHVLLPQWDHQQPSFTLTVFATTILTSWGIHHMVEAPINHVRLRVLRHYTA